MPVTRLDQGRRDPFAVISDFLPAAQAVVDGSGKVLKHNADFRLLFDYDEEPPSPFELRLLLGEENFEDLLEYLAQSHREGIVLHVQTAAGNVKHLKIVSRKVNLDDEIVFCLILSDFSTVKDSSVYFEQSFDQFMTATIDLEEAVKLIEAQKNEIEKMNLELGKVNREMKRDLKLAEILQEELMPQTPAVPGWEIARHFVPMAGVSGDIFDFYRFHGSDHTGVLLLDASGHGVSSALITVIARPIFFRTHRKYSGQKLARAMESANRLLCGQIGQVSSYLTGVSLRLHDDCLKYVNVGHPFVQYYRRSHDKIYGLVNDGALLGIPDMATRYTTRKVLAHSGDVFVLYTDGLTEARNARDEEFGEEGLRRALRRGLAAGGGAETVLQEIRAGFEIEGIDENELQDDLTIIVLRKK